MLSERERRALQEIEREVAAADPSLAASLRVLRADSATPHVRSPHPRRPYTAAVVTAWALVATCLLLGLPAATLGAAALAILAIAVRRWQFPIPRTEKPE